MRNAKMFVNTMSYPQDEAGKIKKEASDLDKLIDKTEKEYNDLRDDLKGKENEVRILLEKGKTEQQVRPLQCFMHFYSFIILFSHQSDCVPLEEKTLQHCQKLINVWSGALE